MCEVPLYHKTAESGYVLLVLRRPDHVRQFQKVKDVPPALSPHSLPYSTVNEI